MKVNLGEPILGHDAENFKRGLKLEIKLLEAAFKPDRTSDLD
jgi:hypothetical protein